MKIAIASGKGGTGKTFVSTNIFNVLKKRKHKTTLVDCDAEAPNAIAFFNASLLKTINVSQYVPVINSKKCTYCGKCHYHCQYNAIFFLKTAKIIKVIEELCHSCGACSVACDFEAVTEKPFSVGQVAVFSLNGEPSLIESRMNIGVMSPVPIIKAALKQAHSDNEIFILDSPPGTSCPFIQTVATADYVILVTEPTPFGLSDLRQSVETLKTLNKPLGVIINRSGLGNDDVYLYLEKENIPLLLEIPFKKEIAKAYSAGKIYTEDNVFFEQQIYGLIMKIKKQYGNSNN
ncbi:MAG: ATP-binding protein [Bacteroidales bacterium]|nr:ATP-binding protein [Bacteroidales bacterium]